MENKLLILGIEFKNIRELLGFTQEEFGQLLGFSKPVIVNLEQEPQRISKVMAISLTTNVYCEMIRRSIILKNIDFTAWENDTKKAETLSALIDIKFSKSVVNKLLRSSYSTVQNDSISTTIMKYSNNIKEASFKLIFNYLFDMISSYQKDPNSLSGDVDELYSLIETSKTPSFVKKVMIKFGDKLKKFQMESDKKISSNLAAFIKQTFHSIQLSIFNIFLKFILNCAESEEGVKEIVLNSKYFQYIDSHLDKEGNVDDEALSKYIENTSFDDIFDIYSFIAIIQKCS